MKQFLTYICDSPVKGKGYFQCGCGLQIEARKSDVRTGKKKSCGCQTKDGRKMNGQKKHPLYKIWGSHHCKNFPEFELFVAELGVPPFEGATVVPLTPGTKASPGNIGWGKPIFTHGQDRITQELFMPLDPKEYGQYNIDAYKEEVKDSSEVWTLSQLTKQYDKIREQYADDPIAMESAIEQLSQVEAVNKYDRTEAKAHASNRAHNASVWQMFKAQILPFVVERMQMVHKSAMQSKSGIHHHVITPILKNGLISSDEIALIGLNTVLDALGDGTGFKTPLIRVYKNIGRKIDDQCYLRWWSCAYESDFHYVDKWILHSNSGYHHKIRKAVQWFTSRVPQGMASSYKRLTGMTDETGKRVGDEAVVHLGEWVFQAIQSCTLWFAAEKMWDPEGKTNHKMYYLGLSAEGMKWKNLINQGIKELLFEAQPMVCEPIPWNEEYHKFNHGGYLTPQPLNFSKLIHGHKGTVPSPEAIRSLNTIQSVGWKINPFMYHTLSALLGKNIKIGEKFVCHERNEFLEQNFPDIDPAVWMLPKSDPEYKRAKQQISRSYSKCKSNEQLAEVPFRALKTAAKFLNYDRIHFPCYFDNRLRIYYLHTSGLHPQGANYAKSLLLFADPLVITDENRAEVQRDLLISIANCYGNDKISFDDRIEFAKDLVVRLENVAKEPLAAGHMAMWTDVSEPFTFLATLRQYHEIFTWKTRNTTDIPNGRDATCSGLQLMSALMRERKAMQYTNVLPSDKPQDLYGEVAAHAKALLQNDLWLQKELEKRIANATKKAEKNGTELSLENVYFELDPNYLSRGVTKRPVMVDSYNGSWRSKNEYVSKELDLLERELGRKVTLAEKATVTTAITEGQNQAFPLCKVIKDFFSDVVKDTIAMQGKNVIKWTTPCGSKLEQRYNKRDVKQIQTFAMGGATLYQTKSHSNTDGSISLSLQKDTDEVAKDRHVTAFSPNYHHSLDAYICQQAILKSGTDILATCHDCFYYRAGEVERGVRGVKDSFYALATSNVLQDLLDSNEVESLLVPRFGDDSLLEEFRESKYCFH